MTIKQVPAHKNNYGVGRLDKKIKYIILHWIVGTLESADATFQNPTRKASAHYGIGDTDIHQYVAEKNTAWHAGNLTMNRESIGIEHEGGWEEPKGSGKRVKPSQKTHETSAKLVADIAKRYDIPLDRKHILKHNEVSNKPTTCSGTLDIDLIIELAKKENNMNLIDLREDIPTWAENELGLKAYPWYDNKWSFADIVKNYDKLHQSLESVVKELKNEKEEYKKLEVIAKAHQSANSKLHEENVALEKRIEALENRPNAFEAFIKYLVGLVKKEATKPSDETGGDTNDTSGKNS